MQLAGTIILVGALLAATAAPACSIGVSTPGVLALSNDGLTLSSGNSGGVATVLVLSNLGLGSTTVTISNTRLDLTPAGFAAAVTYAATYDASWLLGAGHASGSLASSPSFVVPWVLNLVVTITLDNSVTSATGFRQGNYTTKTTVTCS